MIRSVISSMNSSKVPAFCFHRRNSSPITFVYILTKENSFFFWFHGMDIYIANITMNRSYFTIHALFAPFAFTDIIRTDNTAVDMDVGEMSTF